MPDDDRFLAFPTEAEAQVVCGELDQLLEMPWRHKHRQRTLRWDIPYRDALGRWIVTIERKLVDDADRRLASSVKERVRGMIAVAGLTAFEGRPARPEPMI